MSLSQSPLGKTAHATRAQRLVRCALCGGRILGKRSWRRWLDRSTTTDYGDESDGCRHLTTDYRRNPRCKYSSPTTVRIALRSARLPFTPFGPIARFTDASFLLAESRKALSHDRCPVSYEVRDRPSAPSPACDTTDRSPDLRRSSEEEGRSVGKDAPPSPSRIRMSIVATMPTRSAFSILVLLAGYRAAVSSLRQRQKPA